MEELFGPFIPAEYCDYCCDDSFDIRVSLRLCIPMRNLRNSSSFLTSFHRILYGNLKLLIDQVCLLTNTRIMLILMPHKLLRNAVIIFLICNLRYM